MYQTHLDHRTFVLLSQTHLERLWSCGRYSSGLYSYCLSPDKLEDRLESVSGPQPAMLHVLHFNEARQAWCGLACRKHCDSTLLLYRQKIAAKFSRLHPSILGLLLRLVLLPIKPQEPPPGAMHCPLR